MVLALVVVALTGRGAQAAGSACVTVLERGPEAYKVTLGTGCDLRQVARLLPQRDGQSGDVLPMQDQLRSIYAYNEALAQKDPEHSRTVLRGCVPAKGPPPGATAEEREACPKGLVNYYGIASAGNQAIIHVPRTRMATRAERLEQLGQTSCSALAGVEKAYARDGAVPEVIEKTLKTCRQELEGKVAPVALTAPKKTAKQKGGETEPSDAAVAAFDRRIRELEQGRQALVASARQQQKQANLWIGILGAVAVLLLGWNVVMWQRARKLKAASLNAKAPNKEKTPQAVGQLKREYKVKLNEASKEHGAQLRKQIAAMQEVEREYEEAIEQLRQGAREQLEKRDRTIVELERTARMLAQQLQHLETQATKSDKQLEKLRARLRLAKSGDSRVDPRNSDPGGILAPAS